MSVETLERYTKPDPTELTKAGWEDGFDDISVQPPNPGERSPRSERLRTAAHSFGQFALNRTTEVVQNPKVRNAAREVLAEAGRGATADLRNDNGDISTRRVVRAGFNPMGAAQRGLRGAVERGGREVLRQGSRDVFNESRSGRDAPGTEDSFFTPKPTSDPRDIITPQPQIAPPEDSVFTPKPTPNGPTGSPWDF